MAPHSLRLPFTLLLSSIHLPSLLLILILTLPSPCLSHFSQLFSSRTIRKWHPNGNPFRTSRQLQGYGSPIGKPLMPADICTKQFSYNSTGIMGSGFSDWSTNGTNSRFKAGPCLRIPGIHVAQTMNKKLIISDRSETVTRSFTFPGTNRVAIGLELDLTTWSQKPLELLTENYCSTGAFLPDGSFVTLGGFVPPRAATGKLLVRGLVPCGENATSCSCNLLGNLTSYRWYPTSVILPEGRVFIVGGSNQANYINSGQINNPTYEYWPPRNPGDKRALLGFLGIRTLPYNLYPIVFVLPSGNLFMFAGVRYTIFNTLNNTEVPGSYPTLNVKGAGGTTIFRNYPVAAADVMFPLSSSNNYTAEIMICGGCPDMPPSGATPRTCDHRCWRIQPETASPKWVSELMCADWPTCNVTMPRVYGEAVILADGKILIINGGGAKRNAYPVSALRPVLRPLLFDPYTYSWNTVPLAESMIPRLYHSNALMLHNGSVWLSGSNPHQNFVNPTRQYFPSETRAEIFDPPYFFTTQPSPNLTYAPPKIRIDEVFSICFSAALPPATTRQRRKAQSSPGPLTSRFRVALSHAGLATHAQRHSMRYVELDFVKILDLGGGNYAATVLAPPSLNVAPPTFYWLFLLDNGVPNKDGHPVIVTCEAIIPSGTQLPGCVASLWQ